MTAINFIGGWKSWGVQTAAYPSVADVKDNQIVQRRMFNWIGNTLITTFWSKVDDPTNKRLINTIVDSANVWLNGLTAKGALLGTVLAFMMAVTTLSLPSMIMLRKAIRPRLLALFIAVCVIGILIVGFFFNLFSPVLLSGII